MHGYSAEYCRHMIRHNEREMENMEKPARWREVARWCRADWMYKLEIAEY